MSGRSRVRRVEVSPVRRPEPDVGRVVRMLMGLAWEVARQDAKGEKERTVATTRADRRDGGGSVGRVA